MLGLSNWQTPRINATQALARENPKLVRPVANRYAIVFGFRFCDLFFGLVWRVCVFVLRSLSHTTSPYFSLMEMKNADTTIHVGGVQVHHEEMKKVRFTSFRFSLFVLLSFCFCSADVTCRMTIRSREA
jgi:hypothetical protein